VPVNDLGELSDAQLAAETAEKVARPRRDPADSFVLHAPLELTARASLLPYVRPDRRDVARARLFELGRRFQGWGPAAALPTVDDRAYTDAAAAADALVRAVAQGDPDGVDAPASWLGDRVAPAQLASLLGPEVLPLLGAAAHAPIFLFHLPRVAPRGELTGRLVRPLVRELARMPDTRLRWIEDRSATHDSPAEALAEALASVRRRGRPEIGFIAPTMERIDDAETSRLLGPLVGGRDIAARSRVVLRTAARSMLLESTEFAPYIWTHCLTLPQAALGCAPSLPDPSLALAVAASHVAGFRAAFAARDLCGALPEPLEGSLDDAIEAGPDDAARVAIGADPSVRSDLIAVLVSRAAAHTDAHYVKYTLACLDAAADDPASAGLYLAAAAKLAGYWSQIEPE